MKVEYTCYIVPAWSDVASKCNIYVKEGHVKKAYADYDKNPDSWKYVGIMNSRGALVCLDDIGELRKILKEQEPLSAGISIYFEVEE